MSIASRVAARYLRAKDEKPQEKINIPVSINMDEDKLNEIIERFRLFAEAMKAENKEKAREALVELKKLEKKSYSS
jgi:hypothetical protein